MVCKGNSELFNRSIIGKKRYRRSRKWNEEYEDQQLTDNNPGNCNIVINNVTDQVNIESRFERKTELILDRLDEMTINNTNTLKTTLKEFITNQFPDL